MRTFGRLGWQVSEIGHGMWGMGGWAGSDDSESLSALQSSLEQGCNFYDSAWAYGPYVPDRGKNDVRSDRLLGQFIAKNPDKQIFTASKIPPKNDQWPAPKNPPLDEMYPRDHVKQMANEIRRNIGVETVDLLQFHTWDDGLAENEELITTVAMLKDEGYCRGVGISLNTFDASNGIKAIKSEWVDSVQVVYNIFTRDAEDGLFEACKEHNVAVIVRVPFDEGSLTGAINADTTFPAGDWRNTYFGHGNLEETVKRVEQIKPLVPENMTMAQMSLAFVLANSQVSVTIPGMRKPKNVADNFGAPDIKLSSELLEKLREFRWDRHRDASHAN